uniref:ATR n=1 Tax=Arundo donax TaxID=35708 RepID=A0A0A9HJ24_ARUDO
MHLYLQHKLQNKIQMCLKPFFSILDGSTILGKNRVQTSNLYIRE